MVSLLVFLLDLLPSPRLPTSPTLTMTVACLRMVHASVAERDTHYSVDHAVDIAGLCTLYRVATEVNHY